MFFFDEYKYVLNKFTLPVIVNGAKYPVLNSIEIFKTDEGFS